MVSLEYTKALYKIARYDILEKLRSEPLEFEKTIQDVNAVIRDKGFIVLEDYYTPEKCDSVISDIDNLLVKYNDRIVSDNLSADKRLFGAERHSELINGFFSDPFLNQIRDCYYKTTKFYGCTLGARIDAVKGNLGSGGGWHRDAVYGTQLKAILYLTDVNETNGPFQYLIASHNKSSKLEAIKKCGIGFNQNRLDQAIIDKLVNENAYELVTFTAKKGTLLIVDTTGIHRGKPITEDCRYALTNYWYVNPIPPHIEKLIVK